MTRNKPVIVRTKSKSATKKARTKSSCDEPLCDITQVSNWKLEVASLLMILDDHSKGCSELQRLTKKNKVLSFYRSKKGRCVS